MTVSYTEIPGLEAIGCGKVRDLYAVGEDRLLLVASDRISAFDVVLPDSIPGKGAVLTGLSRYWFANTGHIVPNALLDTPVDAVTDGLGPNELADLASRAVLMERVRALPIEAVVRGYLIGSGWKDYQANGEVCGIRLPQGLRLAERLPEPIFTPATKAAPGEHDENIGIDQAAALVGRELAERVRDISLALFAYGAEHAARRGIIVADTKFEFGINAAGQLVLIDEVLTPDSSRFWPAANYQVGVSPPSYDKQYVRDYLNSVSWNHQPPAPRLPEDVIARTAEKYNAALALLAS
ncbi:MAG: phosphoribosylaminoimidazolesuccinocarboxamide synthase [Gammaproteobacteria bacterium]|nr:phosphoribosylaminoimidazolesuccinocarboxamide synthase [Gammaproteobacteria bacterium]MCY4255271.1 phosphoribosylaminoimidazolesuccinocarboxamide synthase [Gammaproteobacteria bacterium]